MGVDAATTTAMAGKTWPSATSITSSPPVSQQQERSFSDEASRTACHGDAALELLVIKFIDYDNDGWPDLLLANGHPDDMLDGSGYGVRYREPLRLFHNEGGRYRNVSDEPGRRFRRS